MRSEEQMTSATPRSGPVPGPPAPKPGPPPGRQGQPSTGGQNATPLIGAEAFQEADITGITMPVTKHNMLVTDATQIPRAIAEAFHLASTGRPGPVLVDIPKDVLQEKTTFSWPPQMKLPGYRPTTRPHGKQIREAAKLMCSARRPVLYVGGGVLKADAADELKRLPQAHKIPGRP